MKNESLTSKKTTTSVLL